MQTRLCLTISCLVLTLLCLAYSAVAQTGSVTPTAAEVASLQPFVAPEVTLIEEPAVDLRKWLPPVGEQRMNDCVAWAVAYAAKSFAEARDQGWRPDHPSRIFSPTYVYNQINDGKDEGSSFVNAVTMMAQQGAATLATAPYMSNDFTRPPTERARQEAKAYQIHDGLLVTDRIGIRRALQRRQVVVFGANVNPMFLAGTFDLYTPALFEKDHTQRRPNQPHGRHAMVIVGYDDQRNAFLVQNSWGTRWNQRGYCWISYELFDQMALQSTDQSGKPIFCNWAMTLVDVEEPIEIGPDGLPRPLPLDLSAVRATGFSDFLRYEKQLAKFLYGFSVELRGQLKAMEQVEDVTWHWIDPFGRPQSLTATHLDGRFGIRSSTTSNPLKVEGVIRYRDGTTRTVTQEVRGPTPLADDFREASILFDHGFYEPDKATGKPVYRWEARLDYPLNERDDIVKVVWNLGKLLPEGDNVFTYDGDFAGVIADQMLLGYATEPDTINVEITYADGGVKRLRHTPVFDAEIIRDISIDVEARELARDDAGRPIYTAVIKLKRPLSADLKINRVVYRVDAHAAIDRLIGISSRHGFPVTVTTGRDFRVRATVEFTDGRQQELERWVELGAGTGYADANRVELIAFDRYMGAFGPGPAWQATFFLVGDLERIGQIERVTLVYPGSDDAGEVIAGDRLRFELSANYLMRKLETRGPIEMSANVRFNDGSESRLRRQHVPQAPVNDALGIEIEMSEKAEHYFNARHQQAHIYSARLTGPDVGLFQIVEVEWYHQAGGEKLRTRLTDNVMAMPEAYTLTSVATEPFELTARLLFHDGYVQHLTVPVVPGVTGTYQPELSLQVTEVFAGYSKTNHQPRWTTYSAIVGDTKVLETIKRVTYLRHRLDGGPAEEPVVREGNRGSWFRATTPHDVTALVELADGQTIRLNNRLRAEAPRSTEAFILRHDPIVAYDNPGGIAHWVRVTGWDFMIDKIRSVRYEAGSFTQTLTFEPGKYGALAVTVPYGSAETVKARIEMEDDRVVELEHPLTEMDRRALGWTWEQGNYWGDGKWVVETRLTGPLKVLSTIRQRAWFQLRDHAAAFEDLPSWPVQRKRVLLEPGEYAVQPPQLQAESRGEVIHLEAGKIVIKNRPLQRSESLQVVVEKSPRQPPEGNSAEWILRLRGPEREMMQVEHVQYRWTSGEVRRQTTVERRWGELYDGYEWRCFSEQAPAVQATVTLRGGRVIELTRMGHLLPAR